MEDLQQKDIASLDTIYEKSADHWLTNENLFMPHHWSIFLQLASQSKLLILTIQSPMNKLIWLHEQNNQIIRFLQLFNGVNKNQKISELVSLAKKKGHYLKKHQSDRTKQRSKQDEYQVFGKSVANFEKDTLKYIIQKQLLFFKNEWLRKTIKMPIIYESKLILNI